MSASGGIADLLRERIADARANNPDRPALLGLAGAQGSGKSYHCRAFATASGERVAHFSLDDVYLTRAERESASNALHPLFATRGPPGTHDLGLARQIIALLMHAEPGAATPLPRFDKLRDDRAPQAEWLSFHGRPDAILIDGWCLGALPSPASVPFNALEAEDDSDGAWRAAMNVQLRGPYASFFDPFDDFVYLQAPSFEIVRRWRGQQEEEMLGRAVTLAEAAVLDRFIQYFERITRAMLNGDHRAGWVVHLDEARNVLVIERRG